MKKFNTIILAAVLIFNINFAEAKSSKQPQNTPGINQTAQLENLNFTAEQKETYRKIRHEEYEEISPILEKIKTKHTELEKLLVSDKTLGDYDARENALKNELKKYLEDIRAIKLKNEEKIHAMLTPEQKEEYRKIKEKSYIETARKVPERSLGSVSTTKNFEFKPCKGSEKEKGCKIDELLKK